MTTTGPMKLEAWPLEGMLQFEVVLRCLVCGWLGYSQISAYFHFTHEHQDVLASILQRNEREDDGDGDQTPALPAVVRPLRHRCTRRPS